MSSAPHLLPGFCPAKINLFLAVTGRRSDGYHDLVSLVAPLDFGDALQLCAAPGADGTANMTCSDPSLDVGPENLVLRAAAAYRRRRQWSGALQFHLDKHIPTGAGLGGGSSDAAGALRLIHAHTGGALPPEELAAAAAEVGSDCPLFLCRGPVVIRGRGESVSPVSAGLAARLKGRKLLLMKPSFGVPTPWAYRALAETPGTYLAAEEAERRLRQLEEGAPLEAGGYNSFSAVVGRKFVALDQIVEDWQAYAGTAALLSGSGSCVYGWMPDTFSPAEAAAWARERLGPNAWVKMACISW